MRTAASAILRWLGLTVILFVTFAVAAMLSGVTQPQPAPPAATGAPAAAAPSPAGPAPAPGAGQAAAQAAGASSLLLFCALVSATFSWAIARSSGWGIRLGLAVFAAYFGLGTFLPQVESALFLPAHLPPGFIQRLFVMGAIVGAVFAPAAVLVWGRLRRPAVAPATGPWLPLRCVVVRPILLAVVYVAVYLLAGYFIAYRNPELVAYYGDTDPGSFTAQLAKAWSGAPWFFAIQFGRGVLWVALVMPLIAWFRGGRLECALLVACLFSVWSVMLLAPNPFMPESIRMSHLVETGTSNFVFGALVGAFLWRRRAP